MAATSTSALDTSFVIVNQEFGTGQQVKFETPTLPVVREDVKANVHHPSNDLDYTPGSSASFAHDWSVEGTGGGLRLHGRHFIDAYGRVCNLRGVNLAGASKTPKNHDHDRFPAEHDSATFVGRPFPLEEAHEHFSRLRRWGLTFIRFLVTWEAIEHAGPGIYDAEYLSYLRSLLSLLPKYGMTALVEVHQDVWSRYSGGSGAPAWTLEAVGFKLNTLHDSGAAWLLGVKGGGFVEEERGVWPCGYQRLTASTMATLFWGGDTFAPKLRVKGSNGQEMSAQEFLQNTFLDMYDMLVRAIGDLEGVIGFEVMNEPHGGFINLPSLHEYNYNTDLHLCHVPSAFQSFMLGAGHPTAVPFWTRSFPMPTRLTSHEVLNSDGVRVWRDDGPTRGQCLWEMHGVWGWDIPKDAGVVLRENYFVKDPMTGREIDWHTDFYYPFLHKWAARVRALCPNKLFFVEAIPNEFCPASWTPDRQLPNMVYSPHWYDLRALFAKAFGDLSIDVQGLSRGMPLLKAFYWGQSGVRENYALQIRNIVEAGYKSLGEVPVIIGESGVPMDMNNGEAFQTDDWKWQARMMDAVFWAIEKSMVGFTLWNYNPANSDLKGDEWNGENFSWFSRSRALPASLLYLDQTSPTLDNGGRILPSVVRPYPAKTAGIPLRFEYEVNNGRFVYEWTNPNSPPILNSTKPTADTIPLTSCETEIFVPSLLAHGRKLIVTGLSPEDGHFYDENRQTLYVVTRASGPGKTSKIVVTFDPAPKPIFEVKGFWDDYGMHVFALLAIVVGCLAAYVWH